MHPTDSALNRVEGSRRRIHSLVFETPEETMAAVKTLKSEGFEVHDVYSPFALHGVEEALELRPSRLGMATLVGGLVGGGAAFAFQIWTHAIDWPLFIGGKTPLALPAQVPVSFELTVLFAAFATVGGLVIRRRLLPRLAPEPLAQPDLRVTDDRFVVLVVERDASFSPARFRAVAASLNPRTVREAWKAL